jgi:hypothetical protein
MTNYRAYLKGKASGTGPSKQELKLRAARCSSDPKKIEEALSQLPGVVVATTQIPHLEGEEIFGSTKRKLDLPLGDDGDSHRPDKVNFSQPQVQTRSRTAHTEVVGASMAGADKDELPHVTTTLESECDMSQWHIVRISHRSSCKCHAQQAATNFKCTARIAKGSKGTATPTYRGRNTQYGGTKVIVSDFWFCPDDIERCVKGSKRSWVLDWPQVPDVWPILSGTNLTHEETLLLQDVGFKMRASSSKNDRQCHLGACSRCPTFLKHLSLITLARQIRMFILQLGTVSPFDGMQMPRRLSIATSRRALATSKERSLVSLFFLFLVLEP